MALTYPTEQARPVPAAALTEENFIPVYARGRKTTRSSGGKVKTWMILEPIGVIVLGGIAAALVMAPPADTIGQAPTQTPLPTAAEAAATQAAATTALTPAAAPTPVRIAPAPVAAAPVVRQATPVRRVAPAPAVRRVAPAPAVRVQTPAAAPVAGPRPYSAPTTSLNTAPAVPAPVTTPAAPPPIVVEPLG